MTRSGRFEWPIVLTIVAIAAISRSPALIVLGAGGLVLWIVVWLTGRLALVGLETHLSVTPDRLIAGEPLVATVTILNRKPLPLPWLDLRLFLPEGIETPEPTPGVARGWVDAGFAPRGHERLVLRFPLVVAQRGAYSVGPIRLRGGDWLGFTVSERTDEVGVQVVAYPAPLAVRDRQLPSLRPLAELAVRRGLLPDPLRFRGVREHRSGDPRKEIHWKASARLRELQTKLYEPATSLDAVFLVNVASYEQYWIQADPEAVEFVVSAAADMVRIAANAGRQVGLVTNGLDNLTHERPRSALGRGPHSLTRALEILARLGPYAANSPEAVFLGERGRLPWGATLVVVTPKVTVGLASAMLALRRTHHRVLGVSIARADDALAAHLRGRGVVLDVLHPAELRRAG
ncbi:MAG TPA: DUF58 domain-containing protein [Candidatus Limnocylindria bacterium]|jgi:uncharacterized protein (DUF58 family)|nr:DUF58 domain-containing protein [Candidatus Limnocylindria bacterium]